MHGVSQRRPSRLALSRRGWLRERLVGGYWGEKLRTDDKGSPPHGVLAFRSIAFFRVLLDPTEENINRQRNKRECYKRVDHGFIHYFYRSS
ncbi:hypothetical protein EXN68_03290 [Rhizobium rhizogenes]|uniref:Uncharacterized protein n=1 Tax=Rhizobium rhizogenes TaxID=359 RepID=A0A546XPQ8_RHIRH|nr:hypothetical protein EXN68_03290 [Rhizobium rhizogenes]